MTLEKKIEIDSMIESSRKLQIEVKSNRFPELFFFSNFSQNLSVVTFSIERKKMAKRNFSEKTKLVKLEEPKNFFQIPEKFILLNKEILLHFTFPSKKNLPNPTMLRIFLSKKYLFATNTIL